MIKKIFRRLIILLLTAALASGGFVWWIYHSPDTVPIPKSTKARLFWHNKVNPWDLQQVRDYCRKFGYNDTYYIICDFGMSSGKKRFYLYNLNSRRRIMSSYCMHGNGGGSTDEKPVFSNKPGSNCSSIGLYALKGIGSYSMKSCIRVTGLDRTNSMARTRGLLIHSSRKTTRFDGGQKYIPLGDESHGCFTISAGSLAQLMAIYSLHGKKKRILMWACT